jgi:hypothetical protein
VLDGGYLHTLVALCVVGIQMRREVDPRACLYAVMVMLNLFICS